MIVRPLLVAAFVAACGSEKTQVIQSEPDARPAEESPHAVSDSRPAGPCPNIAICLSNCDLGDADACVRAGNLRWRGHRAEGDGRTEIDLFRAACDDGNADGCRYLGFRLDGGEGGVPRDAARAKTLFARAAGIYAAACGAKRATACAGLASMTENGEGVRADPARAAALRDSALVLHRSACSLGSAASCAELGYLYRFGDGVAEDKERAAELYGRACDLGLVELCATLGDFHRHRDDMLSAALYRQACDLGDAEGCARLGAMLLDGTGEIDRQPAVALALFQRGCDLGDWKGSCHQAATVLATGQDVPMDLGSAAPLLEKSCTGGNGEGCLALGLLFELGRGVVQDDAMSSEQIDRACALGVKEACTKAAAIQGCEAGKAEDCHALATLYGTAHAGVSDLPRAIDLDRKACEAEYEPACNDARALQGVIDLMQKSCDQGSSLSCYQLGIAYERSLERRDSAVEAFKRACVLGIGDACGRKDSLIDLSSDRDPSP